MARPSLVDGFLSPCEADEAGELLHPPDPPLCSLEDWFGEGGLMLPPDSRMRRNPRFLRLLTELSHPTK